MTDIKLMKSMMKKSRAASLASAAIPNYLHYLLPQEENDGGSEELDVEDAHRDRTFANPSSSPLNISLRSGKLGDDKKRASYKVSTY